MSLPEVSMFHLGPPDWLVDGPGATLPVLGSCAVHVWVLDGELVEAASATVVDWLTPDEILRASRYRRDADRRSFIARRGLLRSLIGRYCGCSPRSIGIATLEFGKPVLADDAGLAFSVSQAQGMALFAFTREAAIGVDIERLTGGIDVVGIAAQVFSGPEMTAMLNCETSGRATCFLSTLVRKEALLKALGKGFYGDTLAYSTIDGIARHHGVALEGWCLSDIDLGAGWHAALAVRRKD